MYVCSCFGITEEQVREHAEAGACTPRQMASASKAGTDCGSCVRRIQGLLGRGSCPRRAGIEQSEPALPPSAAPQPGVREPGAHEPAVREPGVLEPAAVQRAAAQSPAVQPAAA
ncbi:(2Fe-2S)-binding protein [Streptomyces armeniacus]|uniref:Bacterioferritin-associated ferredoxin n=1 Tax=Streptomyces armeniacus TaxID=83291 RepID=A0A345XLV3_9ACTN|nr:(2Fe-2S)-binding protein [Streptomyces armeniacus]AXK32619.1 (2Fe-2S)-binding protein [Streptomyces armeniacus]